MRTSVRIRESWPLLCGLLVSVFFSGQALAVTRTWQYPVSGTWHVPGNWYPSDDYPRSSDTAIVDQGEAQILDPNYAGADADRLFIGLGSGTRGTVSLMGGQSLTLYYEPDDLENEWDAGLVVGGAGEGTFRHISGNLFAEHVAMGVSATGTLTSTTCSSSSRR